MNVPIEAYLSTLRSACESLTVSVEEAAVRRPLDMIVHILNGMIAQAKAQPTLDDAALAAYQTLLPGELDDLASARAAADRLVRGMSADERALPTWQRIVDIERAYFEGAATALQAELQRPREDQSSSTPGGPPDAERIGDYLSRLFATSVRVAKIDTVSLGFSKATFMLDLEADASVPSLVVIRMDKVNSFLGTTVLDEYPILQALHAAGVSVPQPYGLEHTGSVLGQPFMVVSRVAGRGLGSHFNFPAPNRRLCSNIAAALAKVHVMRTSVLGEAFPKQSQSSYEQVITDINKSYADWSSLKIDIPILEIAFALLKEHASGATEGSRTLVHGDFSLSNLLIGENHEVTAILDWEFARLGLPASDLGWCHELASQLGSWEDFLAAYAAAGGTIPSKQQLDFFALWGATRLSVMVFQSRYRFERGEQSDIKHALVTIGPTIEIVLRVQRRLQSLLR